MDPVAGRVARARWMVGFAGARPADDFLRMIDRYRPSALIFFRDNLPDGPASIAPLRRRLEEAADGPLALFLDEEGGWIQQLPEPAWPSPRAQALAGEKSVRACHQAMAGALAALGVEATAAPVADLDDGGANPVIGSRGFGDDPEHAAACVAAAVTGLAAAGVRSVLKHYPGHGDSVEDSPLTLPPVPADRRRAMIPFRAGVEAGADAIMSAHLKLEGDDDTRPATFRPDLMCDRLRGELGFTGLVITDALEMGGAEQIPVDERGAAALAAGNHLLTLGRWEPGAELMLEGCARALSAGRIEEAHLDESRERWRRFLEASAGANAQPAPMPDLASIRRAAVFMPGGGRVEPVARGDVEIDLEFGPLGSWWEGEYLSRLEGPRVRRLPRGEAPRAPVYLYLGRVEPPEGRRNQLEQLQARGEAPAILVNGPWSWTLPFPRRLATADAGPGGLPALLTAAGLRLDG